ncbi:hypothetical protein [Bifidobacterium callitrichos]|uniref:hypothetical protein n=1 Tax=Bifidobacterium callitrichos TaxID=762209 RepID=UPI0011B1FE97|nr:hypothetical protein [Bifidobacterium callitrichos]
MGAYSVFTGCEANPPRNEKLIYGKVKHQANHGVSRSVAHGYAWSRTNAHTPKDAIEIPEPQVADHLKATRQNTNQQKALRAPTDESSAILLMNYQ